MSEKDQRSAWLNPRILQMASFSFFGAIPLQIVDNTMTAWLAAHGVSAKDVGLAAIATLPWSLKFIWSPLLDRFHPPFGGRRRGSMLLAQVALLFSIGIVPFVDPQSAMLVISIGTAIAFFSATQDISMDAYAVELMQPHEQGPGNAMRTTFYRLGMLAAGGVAIAAADALPWKVVFFAVAACMVPGMLLVATAADPSTKIEPPPSLTDAIVLPFKAFFSKKNAIVILLFVLLYKFGDLMVQRMLNPFFLQELKVSLTEVGYAQKTVGMVSTIVGTLIGGALIPRLGLGRALWVFGLLQATVNIGYYATAMTGGARPIMYTAIALEYGFAGMTTAALLTLITRLCDKRLAATQFALLTSFYGLGRVIAGPASGFVVERIGYADFFLGTMIAAVPGLVLLFLIAPPSQREFNPS